LKKAADRKLAEKKLDNDGPISVADILARRIAIIGNDKNNDDDSDDSGDDWDDDDVRFFFFVLLLLELLISMCLCVVGLNSNLCGVNHKNNKLFIGRRFFSRDSNYF
jgi:hypothetical protein